VGISVLSTGASGTGKAKAEEVLANELRLDLYRIDLSQIVSKYIGDTEKNLACVFDIAEEGGAILLFDEADALFGKRSEVKDSHDQYANIEIGYLLRKMEDYAEISSLATKPKENMDDAFLRRLHFLGEFPFPDAMYWYQIWKGHPAIEAPVNKNIDYE
jgi:SpoVK/Ycf46/Vps4 family AAA+-type ATPase